MTAFLAAIQALLALIASGGHTSVSVGPADVRYYPQDDECMVGTNMSRCATDPLPAIMVRDLFMAASRLPTGARDRFGFSGGRFRHHDRYEASCTVHLRCRTQRDYPLSPASVTTGCEIKEVNLLLHENMTAREADHACGLMLEDVLRSGDWRAMDVARLGVRFNSDSCDEPPEWDVIVYFVARDCPYNATLEMVLAGEETPNLDVIPICVKENQRDAAK
jgi:hypothetical protein